MNPTELLKAKDLEILKLKKIINEMERTSILKDKMVTHAHDLVDLIEDNNQSLKAEVNKLKGEINKMSLSDVKGNCHVLYFHTVKRE